MNLEPTPERILICNSHPESKEEKDFYLYEGKKPRCKLCVADLRKQSYERSKGRAEKVPEKTSPASTAPKPVRKPKTREEPSSSPDAWGPYKGLTDSQLLRAKQNRGMAGFAQGTLLWLSPDEWKAREEWKKEYAHKLDQKHGRVKIPEE